MKVLPAGAVGQINYVTHDIRQCIENWVKTVGAGPFYCWELSDPAQIPDRTFRGGMARDTFRACYGFVGALMIEIIQPTNDAPSLVREILDAQGEALQHIFPRIRSLSPGEYDEISARYEANGFPKVSEATIPMSGRASFFDARHTIGLFIELVELPPPSDTIMLSMYDEHISWDGSRPMRPATELFERVTGISAGADPNAGHNWWDE